MRRRLLRLLTTHTPTLADPIAVRPTPSTGRRSLRAASVLAATTLLLSACAPSAPAPAKPASDAGQAKSAPAPTTAAASKPAEAKPAESKPAAAAATTAPAAKSEPKRGGELRVQLLTDSDGLDPAKTTQATAVLIGDTLFDTLVETTPDDQVIPSLAESWEISTDGLTYTFKLRKGVKFHNGRELVAADVKYTIERIKDKATAAPRVNSYTTVTEIQTPDSNTVVFKLSEPFAPLLANLSHVSAGIVPKEVIEAQGDLNANPVGSGPFKFVEWARDQHVKVEANKEYWRPGLPRLDRITFTFNTDENARAAAIRSGTVDFLYQAPEPVMDIFRRDQALTVHGGKGSTSWLYLLLNMQKEPFTDVRVRQAIYWALDRAALAEVGRPGTSTVLAAGFLPPEHWAGLSDPVYKQDYDKARQLLREAGKESGFKFTINSLTGWDFQIRTAQTIQQQLKPLNIDAEVRILDSGNINRAARAGEFEAMILGFSGTLDPDERFQQTFVTGGGANYAKLSDPRIDEIAAQARRTTDRAERAKLYREAQLRLTEIGPKAFLYIYEKYDVTRTYVKDYTWHPGPLYRSLREVWLDK